MSNNLFIYRRCNDEYHDCMLSGLVRGRVEWWEERNWRLEVWGRCGDKLPSFSSSSPHLHNRTMASSFRTAGRKIVAIGRNFAEHAKELNNAVPTEPFFFLKPTSSYLDNGGTIEIPKGVVAHFEGASSS